MGKADAPQALQTPIKSRIRILDLPPTTNTQSETHSPKSRDSLETIPEANHFGLQVVDTPVKVEFTSSLSCLFADAQA